MKLVPLHEADATQAAYKSKKHGVGKKRAGRKKYKKTNTGEKTGN